MNSVRPHLRAHSLTLGWLAARLGLSRNTVKKWSSVPTKHVLAVEAATGIPRHELRPDIYPPPVPTKTTEAA